MKIKQSLCIMLACLGFVCLSSMSFAATSLSGVALPRLFVMNTGQWDGRIHAASIGFGPTVSFSSTGYNVDHLTADYSHDLGSTPRSWPGMRLLETGSECRLMPGDMFGPPLRHIQAEDGSAQAENGSARTHLLAQYRALEFRDAWPGVSITVDGGVSQLRHIIHFEAGADPSLVRMRFDNAQREQISVSMEDASQCKPVIKSRLGGTELTFQGDAQTQAFTVTLVYTFYWGGSDYEVRTGIAVDRAGNLVIYGNTRSPDFPLVPPGSPVKPFSLYLLKCTSDAKTIIYSTWIDIDWMLPYSANLVIGRDDKPVVLAYGDLSSILTPDARYPVSSHAGLLVFDSTGAIEYCSGMPCSELWDPNFSGWWYSDIACDAAGTIYIITNTEGNPACVTPDAIFPIKPGEQDGFIMKFDASNYELQYASFIGGSGFDVYHSIAVDGCGNIAVAGSTTDSLYPLVNPVQSHLAGETDVVITKISPDGRRILFSTYLGGSSQDFGSGWWDYGSKQNHSENTLRFDPDGNLYCAGITQSIDFPLLNPVQAANAGYFDAFVSKFDPQGSLLFSTYIGSTHYDAPGSIDVDACGNAILHGDTRGTDFPLVDPLFTSGRRFLMVMNTNDGSIPFSTLLKDISVVVNGNEAVLDGTTVYTVAESNLERGLPATPGLPSGHQYGSDAVISRIEMPNLCSRPVFQDQRSAAAELAIEVITPDTLFIDLGRLTSFPFPYRIRCRVKNLSLDLMSDSVDISLDLPGGFVMLPPATSTRQHLAPLPPLGIHDIVWDLQPIIDSISPAKTISVTIHGNTGGPCPMPVDTVIDIPVVYTDIIDEDLMCTIDMNVSMELTPDRTRLKNDSAWVLVRVFNHSQKPTALNAVRLILPPDMGVTLLSPTDPVQHPPLIPAQGWVDLSWLLHFQSLPNDREISIQAVLIDTFDLPVEYCQYSLHIPGATGSSCTMTATEPVWYRADDYSFDPSPVELHLTIANPSDTIRSYFGTRLDLTRARHLGLVYNDSLQRSDFNIEARSQKTILWRLAVLPRLTESVTDIVRGRYHTASDSVGHMCETSIRIFVLKADVTCTVIAPDSLHIDPSTGRLDGDTVLVTVIFRNNGELVQELHDARLHLPVGSAVKILDAVQKDLPPLAPGKADTLTWLLDLPAFAWHQTVPVTITAHTSNEDEVTRCSHSIHFPAITLTCALEAPDTIRYDAESNKYIPESFEVTATFYNSTDTELTNIIAVLDTTTLQRSHLLIPSTREQYRISIAAQETWEVRWTLAPVWDKLPADERMNVRFTFGTQQISTQCERSVYIDGAPLREVVHCSTAGHDSVWADAFYEHYIPDPVQIQYTLRNDGFSTLLSCELAILPPPMLMLGAGEDSVRLFPPLLPGEEFQAEWMLTILPDRVTSEPWIVRWTTLCNGTAIETDCETAIHMVLRSPDGLVVTPWILRFKAERYGPLPGSRTVDLWTGGGVLPQWSSVSVPPWIKASPLLGAGHTVMTVRPNTTTLPPGVHRDVIQLDAEPLSTGDIQIVFELFTPLLAPFIHAPTDPILASVYPNPVTIGMVLSVKYASAPMIPVRVLLHDVLGRQLRTLNTEADHTGRGSIQIPTAGIQPGTYILTLHAGIHSAQRLIVFIH